MSTFWIQTIAYIASLCVICSFLMKDMLTLRIVSIIGSIIFLYYGYMIQQTPIIITNLIIILINFIQIFRKQKI